MNDPSFSWLTYSQSTGSITTNSQSFFTGNVASTLLGTGYSGIDTNRFNHNPNLIQGRNNPDAQGEQFIGPLPRGLYYVGDAYYSEKYKDNTMNLTPSPANDMLGRNSFLIHSNNSKHPTEASEGCIVAGPDIRQEIAEARYKYLWVVR